MSRTRPEAGCVLVSFRDGAADGRALRGRPRGLRPRAHPRRRPRKRCPPRARPGWSRACTCAARGQPLSPAAIADIEGFARSLLAGRAGGLGWSLERQRGAADGREPPYRPAVLRAARHLRRRRASRRARWASTTRRPITCSASSMLTVMASVFYAAFCRRWRGFPLLRAMALGATFGLVAQVVIFVATVVSYLARHRRPSSTIRPRSTRTAAGSPGPGGGDPRARARGLPDHQRDRGRDRLGARGACSPTARRRASPPRARRAPRDSPRRRLAATSPAGRGGAGSRAACRAGSRARSARPSPSWCGRRPAR